MVTLILVWFRSRARVRELKKSLQMFETDLAFVRVHPSFAEVMRSRYVLALLRSIDSLKREIEIENQLPLKQFRSLVFEVRNFQFKRLFFSIDLNVQRQNNL